MGFWKVRLSIAGPAPIGEGWGQGVPPMRLPSENFGKIYAYFVKFYKEFV